MKKVFEYGVFGAGFGCTLGGAVGSILAGATLALPGINVVVAPLAFAAATTTVTVSGAAVGTVIGGTVGAIGGAVEEKHRKVKTEA